MFYFHTFNFVKFYDSIVKNITTNLFWLCFDRNQKFEKSMFINYSYQWTFTIIMSIQQESKYYLFYMWEKNYINHISDFILIFSNMRWVLTHLTARHALDFFYPVILIYFNILSFTLWVYKILKIKT